MSGSNDLPLTRGNPCPALAYICPVILLFSLPTGLECLSDATACQSKLISIQLHRPGIGCTISEGIS